MMQWSSLQVLIKQIDSSDNVHTIGSAISNLLSLTQDGPQLCSIIAKVLMDSVLPWSCVDNGYATLVISLNWVEIHFKTGTTNTHWNVSVWDEPHWRIWLCKSLWGRRSWRQWQVSSMMYYILWSAIFPPHLWLRHLILHLHPLHHSERSPVMISSTFCHCSSSRPADLQLSLYTCL